MFAFIFKFECNHFSIVSFIISFAKPSNADVLVLLALLEQVAAQKDRSKRTECRAHAYEYCLLATAMETSVPSTMMAMNQMANHCFHTWKLVVKGGELSTVGIENATAHVVVIGAWQVELELSRSDFKELFLQANDPIKIGSSVFSVNVLTAMEPLPSTLTSDIKERILITLVGKKPLEEQLFGTSSKENSYLKVEIKEFGRVFSLATEVYKKTTVNAVKAESIYILGRIYHAQNNIAPAIEYYKEAYRFCPDLALAIFGHAQIMLSKQELGIALELFEKVQALHPDDRDTQAYVMLVRALYKRESSSLEKVREVASGFAHEVDLWLLQGQLRQTTPAEYSSALRCYTSVLECMERQNRYDNPGQQCLEDPRVLSNMAVLHHSLGRLTVALDFCRRSLIAQQKFSDISEAAGEIDISTTTTTNPVFKNQQFEGVFYSWSDAICTIQPDWTASGWEVIEKEKEKDGFAPSEETKDSTEAANGTPTTLFCSFEVTRNVDGVAEASDLASFFAVGDELLLQQLYEGGEGGAEDPVLHTVMTVTAEGFTSRSHVHRILLNNAGKNRSMPLKLSIKRKVPGTNFSDASITMCYNYARLLEDLGHTNAAKEVYVQLLKQHPSFIDCKYYYSFKEKDGLMTN